MIVITVIHNFVLQISSLQSAGDTYTQRMNNSFFHNSNLLRSENPVIDNVKPKQKIPCRNGKAHGRLQLFYPYLTAMSVFESDATRISRLCCTRGYFSLA